MGWGGQNHSLGKDLFTPSEYAPASGHKKFLPSGRSQSSDRELQHYKHEEKKSEKRDKKGRVREEVLEEARRPKSRSNIPDKVSSIHKRRISLEAPSQVKRVLAGESWV